MSVQSICSLVRDMEHDYTTGTTTISKYVEFSQYENIERIDAYLNSKHISGDTDALGREKPFFNIVTGAVNIWYRATDIDRKNIRIKATKSKDMLASYLATIHLNDWMKRENFGAFLNDWGRNLARYGSCILKFVEKDGMLYALVMPWNRMIVDTIEFEGNPRIEVLELTPAQLRKKEGYDPEMVKALIEAQTKRETLDGTDKDEKAGYIKVYEVHGELPLSYLTDEEADDEIYVQQMQVVAYVEKQDAKGEYDEFTLARGEEDKDPYMITHLIKEDGRTQAIGAVEHLFEAQWMTNHNMKLIKDQLDLASKLIFQTADGNFAGQSALMAIESGDILVHAENKPLTQLANSSHDITSLQNYAVQWQNLAKEITSTPDAIGGNTMPSGTAYRTVAILNQESHSLFEMMTENKGLYIEQMMREYIIPYLKTKMDTTKEIAATLDEQDITRIDSAYIRIETEKRIKRQVIDSIVNGELPEGIDQNGIEADIKEQLSSMGNTRFFKPSEIPEKTWKDALEDLEWEVEVEVTPENTDKEATLTTLSTVLQTIASNPLILQDPNARLLFNRILEETGRISPVELATAQAQPAPTLAQQLPDLPVPQNTSQATPTVT